MDPIAQLAQPLIAYCGRPPTPEAWLSAWTQEPVLWVAMAGWAAWTAVRHRRDRCAWAAWALAAFAYLSPLCALSAAFFSLRVTHHVVLVAAIAPLLALAERTRAARVLPSGRTTHTLSAQVAATLVLGLVLWAWHVPGLYRWGLTHAAGYWLMQISLLGSAVWFWQQVWRQGSDAMASVLALLATAAHMGLLGALIVFSGQLLYPLHAPSALQWGWQPQSDQQLGGLLMWVPASLPFLAAGLWRTGRYLSGLSAERAGLGTSSRLNEQEQPA